MTAPRFRQATVARLVVLAAISFAATVVLSLFGNDLSGTHSYRADSYSRSAIGHQAMVETLRGLGLPVVVSRHRGTAQAGGSTLLLLLEPESFSEDSGQILSDALADAGDALLVLPKWIGVPRRGNPAWVGEVLPVPEVRIERLLLGVEVEGTVVHVPGGEGCVWQTGPFGYAPFLSNAQLLRSEDVIPIIARDEGILLGEIPREEGHLWVLSDPDLLSNHGLTKGDNARLLAAVIQRFLTPGGVVVIDETLHGYVASASIWRELLRFPLVLTTIQALLAGALLLWMAVLRFGSPAPHDVGAGPTKEYLIENTADLLLQGGQGAHTLRRYFQTSLQEVAHRLHAPPTLPVEALTGWLEAAGTARGVSTRLGDLGRRIEEAAAAGTGDTEVLVRLAGDVYTWRKEMMHGA